MPTEFVAPIVLLSIPAFLLGIFRHSWWWSVVLLVLAYGLGLSQGLLYFADIWNLPADTHLLFDARTTLFALLLSIAIGHWIPVVGGIRRKQAILVGALLGNIAPAYMWLRTVEDTHKRGELVFASCIGAMCNPYSLVGASLWVDQPKAYVWFACSVLVGWWLLFRKTEDAVSEAVPYSRLLFVYGAHGVAFATANITGNTDFLAMGALFLIAQKRMFSNTSIAYIVPEKNNQIGTSAIKTIAHALLLFLVVNVAIGAGLAESIAWGLEDMSMEYTPYIASAMFVVGVLASVLVGMFPVLFCATGIVVRCLDVDCGVYLAMMGVASVMGTLWPWIASQTFKLYYKTHLAWVGLVLLVFFLYSAIVLL